ncbi:MAG TPA: DoxX family protein [Verrucomicrobiae bacterium]|jgi:putative oxidoreductase
MANPGNFCAALSNCFLAVLRIVIGIMFFEHGTQKLFNYPAGFGAVPLHSLMGLASVLEIIGGALIVVGLFTRPVAFILCGEMAVAYFKQHAGHGLWPIQNGGELAVLYCFVFLYFVAAGPGGLSLDRLLFRGKKSGG